MPIQHLLIDLDGTLVRVRQLPLRARFVVRAAAALRSRGYDYVPSAFSIFRMIEAVQDGDPALLNETRAVRAFSRTLGVSELAGRRELLALIEWLFPKMQSHFHPVPAATEFVEWASSRYELSLATNPVWPEEIVRLRLSWAGIDPKRFRFISTASNMHWAKPSIGYYQELLEHIGARAEESLLVGDSARKDLPAASVGIRVFLVNNGPAKPIGDRAWKGSFESLKLWLSSQPAQALATERSEAGR